jgi:hypothetical protein
MEPTTMWTVQNIRENGLKISSMGMELKAGLMVRSTLEPINMGKRKVRDSSNGLTKQLMMEILKIIILKGLELTCGLTVENTVDSGLITRCMGKGNSIGLMEKNMKVNE